MTEATRGAIWGTVGSAIVFACVQWFLMSNVYGPQLDKQERATKAAEDSLALSRQQFEASQNQLAEAAKHRDELQKAISDQREKWQSARSKFIVEIRRDISNALYPPVWEPGQAPGPTIVDTARKLIRDRDAAREQLVQVKDGVQHLYDRLDGDIDRIRDRLAQDPPPTDEEIRDLIQQLDKRWGEKARDVSNTVDLLLRSLSCPEI